MTPVSRRACQSLVEVGDDRELGLPIRSLIRACSTVRLSAQFL